MKKTQINSLKINKFIKNKQIYDRKTNKLIKKNKQIYYKKQIYSLKKPNRFIKNK